jgi:hypothetical protein
MRTAIFVYQSTTLTIETSERNLKLVSLDPTFVEVTLPSGTAIPVTPGVYKVESAMRIEVAMQPGIEVTIDADAKLKTTKDPWPDPPPKAQIELPKLTNEILHDFFLDAKALTVSADDVEIG